MSALEDASDVTDDELSVRATALCAGGVADVGLGATGRGASCWRRRLYGRSPRALKDGYLGSYELLVIV